VHHLKKKQDFSGKATKLKDDPRSWIEQIYGSQALLAHVDSIWGIEEDNEGFVFATVARSHETVIEWLEKEPVSQRSLLTESEAFGFKTEQQRKAWERLPREFNWREAKASAGVSFNMITTLIREGTKHGKLIQDSKTKRYRKVQRTPGGDENIGA